MTTISYFSHDHDDTVQMLSSAFAQKNLVPVLGAGFTVGCETSGGRTVPSGSDFQLEMVSAISEHKKFSQEQQEKLQKRTFSEVADFYFNPDWIDPEISRSQLQSAFQNVILPEDKKSFLNDIDWPYLYSLNVDDAIETNSNFMVALPYDDALSERAKDCPTVFKLHGDISYELRHDKSRLIFRKADYLQALTSNKRMLDFLKMDILNKNLIYIGCSLSDELDIAFIVSNQNLTGRKSTRNIIFLSEELDDIDAQQYINVGINTVILIDKGQYSQIYELLGKAYQKSAEMTSTLDEFKTAIVRLPSDQKKNEDFLVKGVSDINANNREYLSTLPYYYAERELEGRIHDSIKKNEITIVLGGRISGKTLSVYNTLDHYKDKEIFIINSTIRIGSKALNQLLGQKNSIIFFDANSLSYENLLVIDRNRKLLLPNKSHIVIAGVRNDIEIQTILSGPGKKSGIVNISNILTADELKTLNKRAISTRLPTFTEGKFLLEKLYNVFALIGENSLISKVPQTKALFNLLYVIAVRHQMTGEEIYFSGITNEEVSASIKTVSPFIDYDEISGNEVVDHTSYKIITNASSWVVAVLREFYRVKGLTWCVDTLFDMFDKSYEKNKQFVIELRKFDNLNFVFSHGNEGAGNLIINLYDRLQKIEGTEPEFFVQKAKAYYNMYHGSNVNEVLTERIRELEMALTWAKTAHQQATVRNIVHVLALISLRKVVEAKTPTDTELSSAVNTLINSISAEGNSVYIKNLLTGEIKGAEYLKRFLLNIENGTYKSPVLLSLRKQIDLIRARVEIATNS